MEQICFGRMSKLFRHKLNAFSWRYAVAGKASAMGGNKFQDVTTILFDLDNTLINTKGADRVACEQVSQYLQTVGVRRSTAQDIVGKFFQLVRDTPQNPSDENGDVDAWRLLLWRQALGPGLATRAADCYARWCEVRARHLHLAPEVHDLLLELRRHYKLGVVTNGPSSSQWEKIRRIPTNLFDAVVVSGDVHHKKPRPAIFEEAFRRLDSAAEECAMVGDRLDTDIAGAQSANCGVTVLLWPEGGFRPEEEGPKPDYVIAHLRELLDLLPERKGFLFLCQNRNLGVFHSLREDAPAWNIG